MGQFAAIAQPIQPKLKSSAPVSICGYVSDSQTLFGFNPIDWPTTDNFIVLIIDQLSIYASIDNIGSIDSKHLHCDIIHPINYRKSYQKFLELHAIVSKSW